MKRYITILVFAFMATGCGKKTNSLKIMATPMPHAQLLEFAKPDLEKEGIHLQIMISNDYNIPNRALAEFEVDANFFQHIPFLNEQIKEFGYKIENFAAIEIEPMGIYSKKIHSLADLADGDTIAIPSDPTNEARALLLLQSNGLIQLKNPDDFNATPLDILSNPKNLQFREIDAALLPRSLDDVAAATINMNYVLETTLSPKKDALALENPKNSPYANVIAIRIGEEKRPDLNALKRAMTSEKMRQFILDTYKGAIIPAF